jgi:DNA-binding transcriptional LysR family regulator
MQSGQGSLFVWDDLRVLLAVQREGSFMHAGRALGLSTSTVARRVSALEEHLRVRLVQRGPRGSTLAKEAAPFIALAQEFESKLDVQGRDVGHAGERLEGAVRISLGDGFVRFVTRMATAFRRKHPAVTFEIVADPRAVDLVKREADVGIRTFKSTGDALLTRRVGDLRYGLYAAEGYLATARPPRSTADLATHAFVGYHGMLERQPEMLWLRERGACRFVLRASHTDGVLEGVLAGEGIAALPVILAEEHSNLRRLLADEALPSKPIYVVMHRTLREVQRVKLFADHLAASVADVLA